MMKKMLLAWMLALSSVFMMAQTDGLVMSYKFNQVNGTNVYDESGYGNVTATLVNEARVATMGSYKVLSLGNGTGYLDMTSAAGNLL